MKVDFRKICMTDIEGKKTPRDFSKEIGNVIFATTKEIGELDLARDIYHKGEVELTKEQAQMVKGYVDANFLAFAKEAILPALEAVINYNPNKETKNLKLKK